MDGQTGFTNNSPKAPKPTPGQQEQFDLLLGRARELMAETKDEWLAALKADPVTAAVEMGTNILHTLVGQSEKAGQKVDPVVLLHVGIQFIKDVAGVANAAGVVPDEQLPTYIKDITQQAMAAYLKADQADQADQAEAGPVPADGMSAVLDQMGKGPVQ